MSVLEVEYDPREEAYTGYCRVHKQRVEDNACDLCEDIDWVCGECEEVRYGDARVESGLKCGHCAYDSFQY